MAEKVFPEKRLSFQGLKPTDYYLYKTIKEHFGYQPRQVLVLGLRMIYACAGGQITRDQMLQIAAGLHQESLDTEPAERPVYRTLAQQLRQ